MRQKATPKGVDKRRQKRSKLGRSELMAVRSVIWRRICPEKVANTFEDALKMTLYLVHQTGPTGFVLKEEREKSKIKVGHNYRNLYTLAIKNSYNLAIYSSVQNVVFIIELMLQAFILHLKYLQQNL